MGEEVEVVQGYKYLDVHLENRMDWRRNTDFAYEKRQSRLYFYRKLRLFSVCSKMLHIFYESVMERTILSAVICWWGSSACDLMK